LSARAPAEALEARPESQRTRLDYDRVLDAYRAIYHGDPASPKADASVLAVAELLAEEGRLFSDEKLLHDAIGQYEFLRCNILPAATASPPHRRGRDLPRDLGDREQAKKNFSSFSKPTRRTRWRSRPHRAERIRRGTSTCASGPPRRGRNAVLAAAIESQHPHPAT
jgi:N-acetylmuramoyl-L-alanine amidase